MFVFWERPALFTRALVMASCFGLCVVIRKDSLFSAVTSIMNLLYPPRLGPVTKLTPFHTGNENVLPCRLFLPPSTSWNLYIKRETSLINRVFSLFFFPSHEIYNPMLGSIAYTAEWKERSSRRGRLGSTTAGCRLTAWRGSGDERQRASEPGSEEQE